MPNTMRFKHTFGGHNFWLIPADEAAEQYLQRHLKWLEEQENKGLANFLEMANSYARLQRTFPVSDQAHIDNKNGDGWNNPFKPGEEGFEDYNKAYWEAGNEG